MSSPLPNILELIQIIYTSFGFPAYKIMLFLNNDNFIFSLLVSYISSTMSNKSVDSGRPHFSIVNKNLSILQGHKNIFLLYLL